MIFSERHRPHSVHDLVFADLHVRDLIYRYATQRPSKSLLLYGEPGTGKSEAVRLIAKAICERAGLDHFEAAHNGADAHPAVFTTILNQANWQILQGMERALIIIDEVDDYEGKLPSKMRTFIEQHPSVQFLCTTNYINKIKPALLSRFRAVEVKKPTSSDWVPRALQIFQAEGCEVSHAQVAQMLQHFIGDARDLIDLVEEYILSGHLAAAPSSVPKSVAALLAQDTSTKGTTP